METLFNSSQCVRITGFESQVKVAATSHLRGWASQRQRRRRDTVPILDTPRPSCIVGRRGSAHTHVPIAVASAPIQQPARTVSTTPHHASDGESPRTQTMLPARSIPCRRPPLLNRYVALAPHEVPRTRGTVNAHATRSAFLTDVRNEAAPSSPPHSPSRPFPEPFIAQPQPNRPPTPSIPVIVDWQTRFRHRHLALHSTYIHPLPTYTELAHAYPIGCALDRAPGHMHMRSPLPRHAPLPSLALSSSLRTMTACRCGLVIGHAPSQGSLFDGLMAYTFDERPSAHRRAASGARPTQRGRVGGASTLYPRSGEGMCVPLFWTETPGPSPSSLLTSKRKHMRLALEMPPLLIASSRLWFFLQRSWGLASVIPALDTLTVFPTVVPFVHLGMSGSSDGKVRFGSGSGHFASNAEPERGVAFSNSLNLNLNAAFRFGSAFERVRTFLTSAVSDSQKKF
ncbi:hypothetical protein R3P38DRAFT_3184055 [Favolaschia claudopus]|uniref:Uncharacterized protein n=1 Tax=Favolaschia claudopus TaxID=2862362 RepID=A0AAW0CBM9_9AGAR